MSTAEDCFVCRKHRGEVEVPGGFLYEDEHVVAAHRGFVGDETTMYRGWCLVEPKRHVPRLGDLDDEEAAALGVAVNRTARALEETLGVEHVYSFVLGHGLAKPHLHVHVVPRHLDTPDEVRGLAVAEWDGKPMIGAGEIAALSARLRDVYGESA